ncbi:MAG: multiheme c-type cytochrome [Flavisolibacter sp.]
MKAIFKGYKRIWIVTVLFISIVVLSKCINHDAKTAIDLRGEKYIGAEACKSCHQSIFNSYLPTAHHHTSSAASAGTIKGSFAPGHNVFEYSDSLKVVMEEKNGGFFQTAYENGASTESQPFDVVMGSGRKAQTYLYYDGSKVFQLPVSYFVTEHSWANSPNFPRSFPKFDRSIPTGCFGCHSSYAQVQQSYKGFQLEEAFEKGKMIYGIDCERCHGPAADHVAYQASHPAEKKAKFMARVASLSRQQQIDMCAICHSGFREMQQPAFGFKPGDKLADYFLPEYKIVDVNHMDVHGNQTQLMMASQCYLQSKTLTCTSCHDVHKNERDDMAVFSRRCTNCHKSVDHSFVKEDKKLDAVAQINCIDCHMPLKPSSVITMLTQQKASAKPDFIRTHLVKVYPDETEKVLLYLKQKGL